MKKIYSILLALIFSSTLNAQCPTFSLNMSGTAITCTNPFITVTAVNTSTLTGVSYFWAPPGFSGNPFNCNSAGNYSVMASTSTSTCVVTHTFIVFQNTAPPSVTASNSGPICAGQTATAGLG